MILNKISNSACTNLVPVFWACQCSRHADRFFQRNISYWSLPVHAEFLGQYCGGIWTIDQVMLKPVDFQLTLLLHRVNRNTYLKFHFIHNMSSIEMTYSFVCFRCIAMWFVKMYLHSSFQYYMRFIIGATYVFTTSSHVFWNLLRYFQSILRNLDIIDKNQRHTEEISSIYQLNWVSKILEMDIRRYENTVCYKNHSLKLNI